MYYFLDLLNQNTHVQFMQASSWLYFYIRRRFQLSSNQQKYLPVSNQNYERGFVNLSRSIVGICKKQKQIQKQYGCENSLSTQRQQEIIIAGTNVNIVSQFCGFGPDKLNDLQQCLQKWWKLVSFQCAYC
eukprot:TRINITY_DN10464_c0_g1_i5.p3 TRINITY_DN10464_c0_g1~~TRINITY_DN10464_c0_g1_i5.p3  ORF type:complete len:130 (-),score=4.61 TRINITY_DN10464_c0_g1_i5:342-731(-)